jgi:hypothetical protein
MHLDTFSVSESALNISRFGVALDDFQNLVAIKVWHHHVQEYEIEFFFVQEGNRFIPASCARDPLMPVSFEKQLQRIAIVVIVIDNQDTWNVRTHTVLV